MLSNDLIDMKGKTLLLVCCAPCCAGVVDFIAEHKLDFTLFFYNPNIYPKEEYIHRKDEVIRLAKLYNLPFIDTDYTPDDYFNSTKGLSQCPERGERCFLCFSLRLLKTAIYARDNGFDYFSSTLGFSRWKDLKQVDTAGFEIEHITNIPYLDVNWRKCGIQERATKVIKDNNIYEQNYCGCVYSFKQKHPE